MNELKQIYKIHIKSKCEICNEDIIKCSYNRKYCDSCSKIKAQSDKNRWKRENYKNKIIVKLCKLCASTYISTQEKKVYCSVKCRLNGARIGRYEEQILRLQRVIFDLRGKRKW